MMDARTLLALVVLESFEASEGSSAGNQFMAEARLVLPEVVVLVHLLVLVFVVICWLLGTARPMLGWSVTYPRNPL